MLPISVAAGWRTRHLMSVAVVASIGITLNMALSQPATSGEEEYGEFLARPEELASVPTNDIVKSIRMNATASY
jgi:hypothetical protein